MTERVSFTVDLEPDCPPYLWTWRGVEEGMPRLLAMLAEAAGDSGRRIRMRRILGQGEDHPEVLTIPETGYLKGALLEAE